MAAAVADPLRALEEAALAGLAVHLGQAHHRGRVVGEAGVDGDAESPAEEIGRRAASSFA